MKQLFSFPIAVLTLCALCEVAHGDIFNQVRTLLQTDIPKFLSEANYKYSETLENNLIETLMEKLLSQLFLYADDVITPESLGTFITFINSNQANSDCISVQIHYDYGDIASTHINLTEIEMLPY